MKKALFIIILSAMLTACGNTAKEAKAETSAVSRTTTAAVTASETETTTFRIAGATTTKSVSTSETASTTRKETTTAKSTTTTKAVTKSTNTNQIQQTVIQTHINNEVIPTTQKQTSSAQTEVTPIEIEPVTTTVQTTILAETTTEIITVPEPTEIDWSDSMKVWRKLCEGQQLSDGEMELVRNEIIHYAVSSFGGRTDIHVSFGSDSHDIAYEKPLNLIINPDLMDMCFAHYDAYSNPGRAWLIENAADEQEIYEIVSDARDSCLHIIDKGLFNRWEIFGMNGMLKYASDLEFNIGFDEDMTVWFLTKD